MISHLECQMTISTAVAEQILHLVCLSINFYVQDVIFE